MVETEFKDGAADEEDATVNAQPTESSATVPQVGDQENDLPKPKALKKLSMEKESGVNKYVYYVCNYGIFILI